jgi:hypothetical protein
MSEKHTSGPAFPVPGLQHDEDFNGMTLRDYFAAKAMHAIYMRSGGSAGVHSDHDGGLTHSAECAYAMADAMLKARSA